jgi:RNA polymerase sigma-70 factor, ECF subfamily
LEDHQLATEAAKGDYQAFRVLFERYRKTVYSLAYRVVLNPEDALDITQTVWMKVAEKIEQFDGHGTFRSWLATVATRQALDHLRGPRRFETVTDPEVLDDLREENSSQDCPPIRSATEQAEERGRVEQAMQALSFQQRAILTLQLVEDLGPKEIAQRLGLPDRQVRVQLHRAIVKLRELLG